MIRYDTVLFDLDGTLLNTLQDLAQAVNHAMREGGYPEHSEQKIKSFIGNGVGMLIRRALPRSAEGNEEAFEEALQTFKRYYAAHNCDATDPYDGIGDMLQALCSHRVKMAIISNKNEPNVLVLNRKYFAKWVSLAVGEKEGVRRKPAPDMVLEAMKQLNSQPQSTLYVGDSDVDLETARNAGVDCASVCWGFQDEQKLVNAGATRLIHKPEELTDLILGQDA